MFTCTAFKRSKTLIYREVGNNTKQVIFLSRWINQQYKDISSSKEAMRNNHNLNKSSDNASSNQYFMRNIVKLREITEMKQWNMRDGSSTQYSVRLHTGLFFLHVCFASSFEMEVAMTSIWVFIGYQVKTLTQICILCNCFLENFCPSCWLKKEA